MTALDRAFIKAYSRPWARSAGQAAETVRTSVTFSAAAATHRIDVAVAGPGLVIAPADREPAAELPGGQATGVDAAATESAVASDYSASLPTLEELDSHAAAVERSTALQFEAYERRRNLAETPAVPNEHGLRIAASAEPSEEESATLVKSTPARPLSEFTTRRVQPVRPQLEVDRFIWSSTSEQLCQTAQAALDGFVSRLLSAAAEGQRRVALVGLQPQSGRSLVAACLARRAGSRGSNWVLVDADFAQPSVAGNLGVASQISWSDVLSGDQRLADCLIASVDDRFAIAPLAGGCVEPAQLPGNLRAVSMFDELAASFELVLIDAAAAGPAGIEDLTALGRAARPDAVYIVCDARRTEPGEAREFAERLSAAGIAVAGNILNFSARDLRVAEHLT